MVRGYGKGRFKSYEQQKAVFASMRKRSTLYKPKIAKRKLTEFQRERSERARLIDARQTANVTVLPSSPAAHEWLKTPEKMDIRGIDSKGRGVKGIKKARVKKIKKKALAKPKRVLKIREKKKPEVKPIKVAKPPKPRKVKPKRKPTGKPMTKGLQVYLIKKTLKKRDIEPDVVDVEALVDSNLNLEENTKNILKAVGKRKEVEVEKGREPEIEKSEEAMLEDAKKRVARGEDGHLKGFVEGYERRKKIEEMI